MNWDSVRLALYTWASTYSGVPVVWANQSEVQPERPYISLRINTVSGASETRKPMSSANDLKVFFTKDFSISISYFGAAGTLDSMDKLCSLLCTLARRDVLSVLSVEDIGVIRVGDIEDATYVEDIRHCSRADSEIDFRTSYVMIAPTNVDYGIIEHVQVTPGFSPDVRILFIGQRKEITYPVLHDAYGAVIPQVYLVTDIGSGAYVNKISMKNDGVFSVLLMHYPGMVCSFTVVDPLDETNIWESGIYRIQDNIRADV